MLGGVDPVVFTQSKYVLDQSGDKNGFYTNITKYRKLEENNSLNNLKKLISRMDGLSSTDPSKKVTVNDIIGTSLKDDGVNRW